MFDSFIRLVREIYQTDAFIPLHAPRFLGNEKKYLNDVLDSTYVSTIGPYVERFEAEVAKFTGARYAVATVSGTAALHTALILAGVKPGEEVITQALTFTATANAVHYCGAEPVFIDVERSTLGMSVVALDRFLAERTERRGDYFFNKKTGKRIAACLPMHTFGHPCDIPGLLEVCRRYQLPLVEDAAEALGSRLNGKHCGTFGLLGAISFNGNKIMTTGGGGMILTDDENLAKEALHLTTTAKLPHPWQFVHDRIGFNYRMPNLNAALGVAQLESLPVYVQKKRALAQVYREWSRKHGFVSVDEPVSAASNYWLNALVLSDIQQRDEFLQFSLGQKVMTRPVWEPLNHLPAYRHCCHDGLTNTLWLADRLVNLPSSVTP
ncbi:MAG: aminotransferase DegT [Methylobacter sp.]|nr:MAG: aminotransferase DegT [Methylobacter sp.]